jgi:hypothetical protein
MLERVYQAQLIKRLRRLFPGCVILKNDPDYMQGVPDLTILFRTHWALLEVKADAYSPVQPNQEFYIEQLNEMSFAAFIHPDNEEEVLHALQHAFQFSGHSCLPECEQLSLAELRRGQASA